MEGNSKGGTAAAAAAPSGEVDWSWKRPATRHVACNINGYVRLAIVEIIRKGLQAAGGDDLVARFRDSCFGHFLRPTWDTGVPGYTAIHSLFTNEVIIPGTDEELFTFRVGNKFISFGRQEYALVTGLRFGSTDFDVNSSRSHSEQSVYARYTTAVSVSGDKLRDNFKEGVFRGSADDSLKVAKVLAAYFIVLGENGQKKLPHKWLWHLVEDHERWESFPWGAYSWDKVRHYIRDIPIDIENKKLYHVYGNFYAVLVRAVEAVPSLVGRVAVKIDGAEPMPWMTRFQCTRGRGYDYTTYFDSQIECIERLVPSPEEESAVYLRQLDLPLPPCARYMYKPSSKKLQHKAPKNASVPVSDDDDGDDGEQDAPAAPARKRVRTRAVSPEPVRQGKHGQVGELPARGVREGTKGDVSGTGKMDDRVNREGVDAYDARTARVFPHQEGLVHRIALMLTEERQHITDFVRREGDRMRAEMHDQFAKQKNYSGTGKMDNRVNREGVDAYDARTARVFPHQEGLVHRIALMLTEERTHY